MIFAGYRFETISARSDGSSGAGGVEAEEKAVRYVAKAGDGSMRDALSLLDQCIAFNLGKKLTYDATLDVLGTVDIQVYSELLDFIMAQDVAKVMDLIEDVASQGREWSQFITDFFVVSKESFISWAGNRCRRSIRSIY